MDSRFNLSEWALNNRALVLYAMLVLAFLGVASYQGLGQSEDPPFTFKVMVVRAEWPGASAREVEQQVTDKIEKKLQETPYIDRVQSGNLPVFRALTPTGEEKLIREAVLQFKLGSLDLQYFRDKFGVDLREQFPAALEYIRSTGNLTEDDNFLRLNIEGLLQVDRYVHEFFLPQHRDSRYA